MNFLMLQDVKCNLPYLKRFLKKLIVEIESNGDVVLDELYEKYIYCLASVKVNIFKNCYQ